MFGDVFHDAAKWRSKINIFFFWFAARLIISFAFSAHVSPYMRRMIVILECPRCLRQTNQASKQTYPMQGGDARAYYHTNVPGMQTNFETRFSFPASGLHSGNTAIGRAGA